MKFSFLDCGFVLSLKKPTSLLGYKRWEFFSETKSPTFQNKEEIYTQIVLGSKIRNCFKFGLWEAA